MFHSNFPYELNIFLYIYIYVYIFFHFFVVALDGRIYSSIIVNNYHICGFRVSFVSASCFTMIIFSQFSSLRCAISSFREFCRRSLLAVYNLPIYRAIS